MKTKITLMLLFLILLVSFLVLPFQKASTQKFTLPLKSTETYLAKQLPKDSNFTEKIINKNTFLDKGRFIELIDDFYGLEPGGTVTSTSGTHENYPVFPWPPPEPTHIGEFGRDFERTLLGTDETTLAEIYLNLYKALLDTDPNFEAGVFSVPGGFALLAKAERIDPENASPLQGDARWIKTRDLSLTNFIAQLFFEKPGYFRKIAFVITTEIYLGSGDQPLPDIDEGVINIPPQVENDTFKTKKAYVLVYSYQQVRGNNTLEFKKFSAVVHLRAAGILCQLDPVTCEL